MYNCYLLLAFLRKAIKKAYVKEFYEIKRSSFRISTQSD